MVKPFELWEVWVWFYSNSSGLKQLNPVLSIVESQKYDTFSRNKMPWRAILHKLARADVKNSTMANRYLITLVEPWLRSLAGSVFKTFVPTSKHLEIHFTPTLPNNCIADQILETKVNKHLFFYLKLGSNPPLNYLSQVLTTPPKKVSNPHK